MAAPTLNLFIRTPTTANDPSIVSADVGLFYNNIQLTAAGWTNSSGNEWYYDCSGLGDAIYNIRTFERQTDLSIVNASYKWTAATNGTANYYLEAAAGGDPGLFPAETLQKTWDPKENGSSLDTGVNPGNLLAGEYCYGADPSDPIAFITLYVRLSDDADPDSKADGFVTASYNKDMTEGSGVGSLNSGERYYDSGTNRLYVRLSDDGDPTAKGDGFVRINYDLSQHGMSTTGDSWRLTEFRWTLTRTGGLASWPNRYRKFTDPRSGAIIRTATDQVGFNAGWVLTEGTWTVSVTVKNADGEETTATSDPIIIGASNSTIRYIDSSASGAGDGTTLADAYTSIEAAIAGETGNDNRKFIISDGHSESKATGYTNVTDSNWHFYVAPGDTAATTCTAAGGTPSLIVFNFYSTCENVLFEGLTITPGAVYTGNVSTFNCTAPFCGAVAVTISGTYNGNRFNRAFFVDSSGGRAPNYNLIQACTVGATRGYSVVGQLGGEGAQNWVVMGNNLGPSSNESIIRTVGGFHSMSILYNLLDKTGVASKSAYRSVQSIGHVVFGNKSIDGDWILGSISGVDEGREIRCEGNLITGSLGISFTDGGLQITCCNNLVTGLMNPPMTGDSSTDIPIIDIEFVCNGVESKLNGRISDWGYSGGTLTEGFHYQRNRFEGNVNYLCSSAPASYNNAVGMLRIRTAAFTTWTNNQWPDPADYNASYTKIAQIDGSAKTISEWNAISKVGTDLVASSGYDATTFVPDNPQTITTPRGVQRDMWLNARAATSYIGPAISAQVESDDDPSSGGGGGGTPSLTARGLGMMGPNVVFDLLDFN